MGFLLFCIIFVLQIIYIVACLFFSCFDSGSQILLYLTLFALEKFMLKPGRSSEPRACAKGGAGLNEGKEPVSPPPATPTRVAPS
jgi:hypothetical protein